MGSYVNGGTVVALGSTMDWAESDSEQVTMNLQFAEYRDSLDAIVIKDKADGSVIFEYDPSGDELLGENARKYMGAVISCPEFELKEVYEVYAGGIQQGYTGTDVRRGPGGFGGGARPEFPEDMEFPEGMEMPERGGRPGGPEGMEPPSLPDGTEPPAFQEGMKRPEGDMEEAVKAQYDFYMQDKVNNFSGLN